MEFKFINLLNLIYLHHKLFLVSSRFLYSHLTICLRLKNDLIVRGTFSDCPSIFCKAILLIQSYSLLRPREFRL